MSGAGCSPVSDGGRGLKQVDAELGCQLVAFARQRWRAWIETCGYGFHRFGVGVRPSAMAGVD